MMKHEEPFRKLKSGRMSLLMETGNFDFWTEITCESEGKPVRVFIRRDGAQFVTYDAQSGLEEVYSYRPDMGPLTTFSIAFKSSLDLFLARKGHN